MFENLGAGTPSRQPPGLATRRAFANRPRLGLGGVQGAGSVQGSFNKHVYRTKVAIDP